MTPLVFVTFRSARRRRRPNRKHGLRVFVSPRRNFLLYFFRVRCVENFWRSRAETAEAARPLQPTSAPLKGGSS